MQTRDTPTHPLRIFFFSGLITITSLVLVGYYLGFQALIVALILVVVELTFSFDNAIINAKVLSTVTKFWRQMFITLGILIAVVGMRLVFPIIIVATTAGLPALDVVNIALNQPDQYAEELNKAHISIASFGGMFLLMLSLHFFFDKSRKIRWIDILEKPLQSMSKWWLYTAVSATVLCIITILPFNHKPEDTLIAGGIGILTYLVIHGFAELFTKRQMKVSSTALKSGLAGFTAFIYLEILDASFSLDGVIGAFAITNDVILITIGLGIGALWVRSLTIFMVQHRVLSTYRYLEHGAHYTIGVLAVVLLLGIFFDFPEAIAGIAGLLIVGLSILSSVRASKRSPSRKR